MFDEARFFDELEIFEPTRDWAWPFAIVSVPELGTGSYGWFHGLPIIDVA